MIKTILISDVDPKRFITRLNDIIKDKKIIDIKYQSYHFISGYQLNGTPDEVDFVDRALVIYEAEDESEEPTEVETEEIPEETSNASN